MSELFESLNPQQLQAVKHLDGAMLILAGAGSGKTKTITTRLAYLIDLIGIPPQQTLTLTFTNKASIEMRHRAMMLMQNKNITPPLLCTFHRFGLMFLKFYIKYLHREFNFVLLDSDDKKKLLKKIDDSLPVGYVEHIISQCKNNLITSEMFLSQSGNKNQRILAKIYNEYEKTLLQKNLVDFDDLILLPFRILEQDLDFAHEISKKYSYIMVDEYQDTNFLQFNLLQKLCTAHQNICVVGDDDQSIYGWRGADIRNILDFHKHFKHVKIIKLEENYRSTKEILKVANTLIACNVDRMGKILRSNQGDGEPVEVLHFNDENIESYEIAKKIKILLDKGVSGDHIAILFRLNALSRALEEGLNKQKIPYVLLGTIRFYERSEIKDILSYLRYLINDKDDFSLERIINQPKRGIGKTSQEKIFEIAKNANNSVIKCFEMGLYQGVLSDKNLSTLQEFFTILQDLREFIDTPQELLGYLFDRIDLLQTYNKTQEGINRLANIEEFLGLMRDYFINNPHHHLQDFLNNIPLHSDLDMQDSGVKCMSIHTAKGLEFDYVFVIGMEEGFFPLTRDESNLEEERRLAYVAFTRAKKRLYISYVDSRYYRGKRAQINPSQFLKECQVLDQKYQTTKNLSGLEKINKGDLIIHKVFGTGRVESVYQNGGDRVLSINFGGLIKPILESFVKKVEE